MSVDLYAVSTSKGVICADCASQKWPEGVPEDDEHTVVLHSDDWKGTVQGECLECGDFVEPEGL